MRITKETAEIKLLELKLQQLKFRNFRNKRLSRYLNYEIITSSIMPFAFYSFYFVFIVVLIGMILFLPILSKTLWQNEEKGWLTFLIFMLLIPFGVILFIPIASRFIIAAFFSILGFYFFCYIFKFALRDKIDDSDAKIERMTAKLDKLKNPVTDEFFYQ